MKLAYFKRETGKKGILNQLRREGKIPGVIYKHNHAGLPVYINKDEFDAALRSMQAGLLATTVFELHDGNKTCRVLIKELQYHRTTYAVEHLDFASLSDNTLITVNVPITITGVADCVGVKLGGYVRHVIRHLKVSCLPKDLPREFVLDVRDMQVGQSRRLSDLVVPQGVRPIAKMGEVAVVIAKKA